MDRVEIVDEEDNHIGYVPYGELRYEDIYRVSALWVTDKDTGDCLLTQRNWTKINDPGKWMSSASGTIEEGETYDENIVHEAEEEIGLTGLDFHRGPKNFVDDGKHRFFIQWYLAEVDKDTVSVVIQDEEVEDYAWVPIKKLVEEFKNEPKKFVPSMGQALRVLRVN